jgi:flagellar hook protein FlgE
VISSDQNGAALGLRTGVEITRDGIIVAQFSNGATADLYKIPLVTFANPNGLQEESGTAYSETDGSGANNLREAGTGGAGFLEPSTVESSNVDLADEFAKLIVSQRAFTANTKIITTVDQMTEDLLRLR